MSSGVWSELASHESTHMQMLSQLTVGQVDLFSKAHRSVRNFAIEDKKATVATQALSGSEAQELTFGLEGSLVGDFINACHLEIRLPALHDTGTSSGSTGLATYVWAVGYAMIDSVSIFIEGQEVEKLSGDYMELYDELHRKPGQGLQEAVFKFDRITVPELAAISKRAHTLYVPLPFFFTRGPHCVLPVGKHYDSMVGRTVKVEIQCMLRAIKDFAMALPINSGTLSDVTVPKTTAAAATQVDLDWSKIPVQLYVQQVYLEEAESRAMWMSSGASGTYRAMCTTVQSLHGKSSVYPQLDDAGVVDRKKIPLRYPTKNIIFAIADRERLARTLNEVQRENNSNEKIGAVPDPYAGNTGITRLFGDRMSHLIKSSSTPTDQVYNTDWNAKRQGARDLGSFKVGNSGEGIASTEPIGNGDIALRSNGDVKDWRADGQAGCLHLPGNRFDYRACQNGIECEPVESFSLKLNAQERVNTTLKPDYLRTVQTLAFNNRPRKGIYTYSFALDSSSPYPTGTVNLSRIHNRDLRITSTATSSAGQELILYAESINIFEISNGKTAGQFAYTS